MTCFLPVLGSYHYFREHRKLEENCHQTYSQAKFVENTPRESEILDPVFTLKPPMSPNVAKFYDACRQLDRFKLLNLFGLTTRIIVGLALPIILFCTPFCAFGSVVGLLIAGDGIPPIAHLIWQLNKPNWHALPEEEWAMSTDQSLIKVCVYDRSVRISVDI